MLHIVRLKWTDFRGMVKLIKTEQNDPHLGGGRRFCVVAGATFPTPTLVTSGKSV